jgi:hypothetical protein
MQSFHFFSPWGISKSIKYVVLQVYAKLPELAMQLFEAAF